MAIVSLADLGTAIDVSGSAQAIASGEMVYVAQKGNVECQLNGGTTSSVMFDDIQGFLPVGVTSIESATANLEMYLF